MYTVSVSDISAKSQRKFFSSVEKQKQNRRKLQKLSSNELKFQIKYIAKIAQIFYNQRASKWKSFKYHF